MAAAEVEIIYKANADGLNAAVGKITQTNDELVKEAQDTSKKVADEFKKIGGAAAAAFGSSQVKNALKQLNDESLKLTANLKKLQDEQVDLIASGNRVSKAFKDNAAAQAAIKSQIAEVNAQQRQLNDTYGETETKQKSLTGQLRQLKQELSLLESAGQENSEQFEKLTLEAAQLEDQIGDTRERVRVLASDTFKFDAAVGAVGTLASGFEAAQGAAALFGGESEQLNEVIAKTTAATALANGVREIANTLTGQGATKLAILTIAQRAQALATNIATGAIKGFQVALAATGIGAFAVILGVIATRFFAAKAATEAYNAALEKQKEAIKATQDALNNLSTQSSTAADRIKVLRGEETEIAQQRRKEIESATKTEAAAIRQNEAARVNNAAVQKGIINELADARRADARAAARSGVEVTSAETKELEKRLAATNKAIEQNNANIANLTVKRNETVRNINSLYSELEAKEAAEAAKQEAERAAAAAQAAREKAIEQGKKNAQDRLKIVEEGIKLELLTEDEAVQEKIRLAENLADQARLDAQQNIDNATLRAATIKRIDAELSKQRQQILIDEQKRILDNEIKRLETLQAAGQLELAQAEDLAKKKAELAKQDASVITDPVARANAEKAAEVQLQNDLNQIRLDAFKKEAELEIARLTLQQRRGDFTIATQEAIANEQFDIRAEELKKEAAQTKEAQEKLTIDLELNEADRQAKLAEIRANAAIKELEIENTRIETLKVLGKDTLQDRITLIENEADIKRKAIEKELISETEKNAKLELLNAQTQKAIRDEREKTDQEAIDKALKIAGELNEIFGSFIAIQKEQSEQRIQQLTDAAEIEQENINNTLDEYEDKNRKLEASELRLQRRIAAEKLKQAKLDRAKAIFEVFLNTAQAVTSSIAASPATFGQPFAAFAAAQGLLQASLIAAQPLPKFKKGGPVGGRSHEAGGTIIEAEKGEFVVNKQSATRHRDALDAMNRSSDAFKKYIDQRYVRPALLDIASGRKDRAVVVNASLNSKNMEKEIKGLRKDLKNKNTTININGTDSRYLWR
jgi:hypothetical protein